ncbi:hypothetical protein GQ44DRAFT_733621 [Phaeosphaeriaceae sp. PMI808]|nr:hypothetical protein GQ44DRAFT_733621 [Phaeosphaeriaceae sp. PMI808]
MLGDFEEGQQVYALDVSPKETSMYTSMVQKVRRSLAGAVWRSYYTKARASRVTRSPLQKPHMKAKGFGSSMTRISILARSKYAAMLIGYRLRAVSDAMAQAQAEHRVRPARPVDASK